jgi:hypothetical protein
VSSSASSQIVVRVGTRDVSVGTRERSGVDSCLVVGFEDPFTLVAVMGKTPSVEPAITVGFYGVLFGCEDRGCVRCWTFGVRKRRSK